MTTDHPTFPTIDTAQQAAQNAVRLLHEAEMHEPDLGRVEQYVRLAEGWCYVGNLLNELNHE